MNCHDFQDLLVIGAHGRLTADQRAELERHRSACGECAALAGRLAPLLDLQEKALDGNASGPLPDWEKSWAVISEKAVPRRGPAPRLFALVPRWIPAAAAILLVFVLGYFAGRGLLVDSVTSGPAVAGLSPSGLPASLSFTDYADSLKPVLVSFINRGDVPPPEEIRSLEQEIVRDMLLRTRLLRSLAAESGDASRGDLLLDLEFILTSLANLTPGDTASAVHLERMIREKDIALRLRELASPATI
jgi:hypothetical protein